MRTVTMNNLLSLVYISVNMAVLSITNGMGHPREMLSGAHLRLPFEPSPPLLYAEKGPDGNLTIKGVDKELADWLSASLNFTYNYVIVNQSFVLKQGPFQTMINMLLNGTIDIVSSPMARSGSRGLIMDFCFPHIIESYKILSPLPKEKSRLLAPIMPLSTPVWIMILLSLLVTVSFLTILTLYESKVHGNKELTSSRVSRYFTRYLLYVFSNVLGQDDYQDIRSNKMRIFLASWLLITVVIVNSYASRLASYLTLPIYEKSINSFGDLAQRPDVPLTIAVDSVFLETLNDAKSGPYKTIADSVRKNVDQQFTNLGDGFKKMFSGRYSYANARSYTEVLLARDIKQFGTCRMTISKSLPFSDHFVYALPKGSPYNDAISKRFVFLWETGLMEGWTRPYRGRYEQCIIKPARPRMARLQMKDLYSAFILLGIGVGISFVTFLYSAIPLICNRIIEKFPTSENERKARETLFKGIHQGRLVRGVKKEKN